MEDVERLLQEGDLSKRRAATAMNERSTRAHTLLILNLTQTRKSSSSSTTNLGFEEVNSKLVLADLGGAERLNKSKADEGTRALVTVVGGEEQTRISLHEYYEARKRVMEVKNPTDRDRS